MEGKEEVEGGAGSGLEPRQARLRPGSGRTAAPHPTPFMSRRTRGGEERRAGGAGRGGSGDVCVCSVMCVCVCVFTAGSFIIGIRSCFGEAEAAA